MAKFSEQGLRKQKIKKWVNESFVPTIGKLGNQRHLSSLRDGFSIVTPLIIASAVALILLTSVFGGYGSEKASLLGVFASWDGNTTTVAATGEVTAFKLADNTLNVWGQVSDEMTRVLGATNNFGIGLLAVYFVFAFGFFLSKSRGNSSPEIGGLVALGCFFIATGGGYSSASFIDYTGAVKPLVGDLKGSSGIFTAIVVTIFSVEIYCWLSKIKRLEISLPAGIPPAVSRSFAKLIPVIGAGIAVTALFALVAVPTHLTNAAMLTSQRNTETNTVIIGSSLAAPGSFYNIGDLIYMAIQAPFIYAATIDGANLGIAVLQAFLSGCFWFLGIHGNNITSGIFAPVFLTLLAFNASLLAQPNGAELLAKNGVVFVYYVYELFVCIGGSGATLPLILGTLWFGKRASERAIAKFSVPAGVFNINEPVIFGYPMVANFRYVIPFIFVMPILAVSTWVFFTVFGTTKVTVAVPWTAPPGLGALFQTQFDYTSFLIMVINFTIAFLIWLPFVFLSNRQKDSPVKEAAAATEAESEPILRGAEV